MKRIGMIVALSTLLMVGCTKKPSEIKMPNSKEELQEVADYINKNLEGDDKALASEAVAKSAMAVAIGMPVNKEMTLADAMQRIKAEKEKEKALQQKNATVIAEMNKSVKVEYLNHYEFAKDGLPFKGYKIAINFTNTSNKNINIVGGNLIFKDPFGKESGNVKVEYIGDIEPSRMIGIDFPIFPSMGQDTFKDMPYTSKDVVFQPTQIAFSDKSTLSVIE